MSITQITREFLGLSSDTKPTSVATGSKFIELDTKKVFIFDGSSWYLNPTPVMVTDSLPTGSNIIGRVGIDSGNNGVSIVGSLANITGAVQNVTTAGTRLQLPDIDCHEVTIIAKRLNTGYIYAGGSDVSSSVYGVELAALESYTFPVANANQIYIDSSVNGEGISYVAV
ncbi:hypothetical protein [Dehalobacter restrictus]|uniref:Uncharacterized protein n=1 Tax=Dehalobacter restrictus TaxID=55583 RepID=A0A857DJG8_9FIRM|nr:hypothetical protein [Dehalobacter restrictus]QHA00953.1 hypothetical protein GQ588_10060 [Dehalobacter restrictus]